MSIRFIHIADTHLGAGGFGNRLNEQGYNQREEDLCQSFHLAVDQILQLAPDFVLHAGDLFHTVRPTNRIINFAMREILRLTQAGIPFVVISGNHDAPRQRAMGPVLSIFENLPGVSAVFRGVYQQIKIGTAVIGCLPHCLTPEELQAQLAQAYPSNAEYNILLAHGVAEGIPLFSMAELHEMEIPSSVLGAGFDYVALGHFHRFAEAAKRVYYAGSTERLSFAECGEEKGFLEVSLPDFYVKFHPLPTRDMIDLGPIDARSLNYADLEEKLAQILAGIDLKNKIVRLRIGGLSDAIYNNLPLQQIRARTAEAFYFKLVAEREGAHKISLDRDAKIGSLLEEFRALLKVQPVSEVDRGELLRLAEDYFQRSQE